MYSPVGLNAQWFHSNRLTTSWNLCSTSSTILSRGVSSVITGMCIVRNIRSRELTSSCRPDLETRRNEMRFLVIRVEWTISAVEELMMLTQPLVVAEMMYSPVESKAVTRVSWRWSGRERFSSGLKSSSSSLLLLLVSLGIRRRTVGSGCLRTVGPEISTMYGWSSCTAQTNFKLTVC